MTTKRPYQLKERAKSQEETRQKIVEATMHLHEELGPRATTISAIAERAGVQRLTVYRHFPDETAVFKACTSHWLSLNPPPDPMEWADIADPRKRLAAVLAAFYRYYGTTQRMWTVSHRDVVDVPALQEPMARFAGYLSGIAGDLAARLTATPGDRGPVEATIRHALRFPTWADLDEQGLATDEKVRLATCWVGGVMDGSCGPA